MSESEGSKEAPRFEINTGTQDSASASFNPDGSVVSTTAKESVGVAFNSDGTTERTDFADDAELEKEVDESLNDEGTEEEGDKPDTEEAPEADPLPDFDADNEEVLKAYTERYVTESGELNFAEFNKSFYKSIADGAEKPDITPNERAFVKKRLGISDAAIDTYLSGVADGAKKADEAFYSAYGDKASFDAAFAWATAEGGYTPAQRERFNKALASNDPELIQEQIDLLKVRSAGKVPTTPKQKQEAPAPKERRKSSPDVSATVATPSGNPAIQPYDSLSEYQRDMAAASAKNDIPAMRAAEKRLAASKKLYSGR